MSYIFANIHGLSIFIEILKDKIGDFCILLLHVNSESDFSLFISAADLYV